MHLNIDCLGFIVALRASLPDPATGNLMNKIYLALEASPGFRPLTREELVYETGRAFKMLTGDGELVEDWDKRAGAL